MYLEHIDSAILTSPVSPILSLSTIYFGSDISVHCSVLMQTCIQNDLSTHVLQLTVKNVGWKILVR